MAGLRIIGGRWKRLQLPVPDRPGLRPTPDRVRETLFNWLGQDLSGWRVLDAFAGAGGLGFEAASRGAAAVFMLERDGRTAQSLQVSCARLGSPADQVICVLRTDALEWMRGAGLVHGPLDLVLLDPPFDSDLLVPTLRLLRSGATPSPSGARLVRPGTRVYVESAHAVDEEWLQQQGLGSAPADGVHFTILRKGRAGTVHYHLLEIRHEGGQE